MNSHSFLLASILLMLFGCLPASHRSNQSDVYSESQLRQFCTIRTSLGSQQNLSFESELVIKELLLEYQVAEARYGEILRQKMSGKHLQLEKNEEELLQRLKVRNRQLSEDQLKKDEALILSEGMQPEVYFQMLHQYERSTSFQNRVYNTCRES